MRWIALVTVLAGCNPGRSAAVQALDAADIALSEAGLLSSLADSLGGVSISTGDDAAAAVAVAWPGQWLPEGCLVVGPPPATVTAVFDHCNGPYGMQDVSGTVVILFTSTSSSASNTKTIAATAEGVGFSSNGAVFDVQ